MTKIAKLRHRVQIESFTETEGSGYTTNKVFTPIMTVFAECMPVSGYVTFMAQQIGQNITHKFMMRWQPYVTSENWILMDGRRFRIRSVKNYLEKNRFLELMCEEMFFAYDEFRVSENAVGDPLRWPVEFGVALCMCTDNINLYPSTYLLLTDKFVFVRE